VGPFGSTQKETCGIPFFLKKKEEKRKSFKLKSHVLSPHSEEKKKRRKEVDFFLT